jgi:hypothetical protein
LQHQWSWRREGEKGDGGCTNVREGRDGGGAGAGKWEEREKGYGCNAKKGVGEVSEVEKVGGEREGP